MSYSLGAYPAAYQIFHTLAYDNPAALSNIKEARIMIGATDLMVKLEYQGYVGQTYGRALSDTNTAFPYFSAAKRINPKWIVAFEITHPGFTNIRFPANSFISTLAVDTIVKNNNYSPKISYQVTEKLAIGLGFDANNFTNAQVNYQYLQQGKLINLSQGWGYGWDAGIFWKFHAKHSLSFNYYSAIDIQRLTGTSQLGNLIQPNFSDNIILPNTYQANLIHQIFPQWTLIETLRFVQWSSERNLTMKNTVIGDVFTPLNYNNAWSGAVSLHHQWAQQWGTYVAAEYDQSPQATQYRQIGLPTTGLGIVGAGLNYQITSQWCTKLQYAYAFAKPRINLAGPPVQAGHITVDVNIVDLSLTWQI